jgi:predicted ribosome quality control (RQC) complex YloA/Tae2 family protein
MSPAGDNTGQLEQSFRDSSCTFIWKLYPKTHRMSWYSPQTVEGLFIAKQLEEIAALLPAQNLGWAFPNETSAALLLQTPSGIQNLVLEYRAPSPALYLSRAKLSGEARNAFQRGLELRAKGDLLQIAQLKLDRVVWLEFAPSKGFVSTQAVRLLFELTGRNANLLLLETDDTAHHVNAAQHANTSPTNAKIILAAREITGSRNRFRTVRTGGIYTPPPPYQKLDPRHATDAALETALANLPVPDWAKRIDGLGPTLLRELEHRQTPACPALPVCLSKPKPAPKPSVWQRCSTCCANPC